MRRTATRIRSGCASSARTTARRPPTRRSAPRAAYYGATSYVDTQFGSVLAALEQCGFADDTIVIVTSDHGDMLGERAWYKMTFFEGGCRVPLIIHAPGRFDAARVCGVSHVDLLPTLVDLAGAAPAGGWPDPIDGASLVPCTARRRTTSRSANTWRKARSRRS